MCSRSGTRARAGLAEATRLRLLVALFLGGSPVSTAAFGSLPCEIVSAPIDNSSIYVSGGPSACTQLADGLNGHFNAPGAVAAMYLYSAKNLDAVMRVAIIVWLLSF